MVDKKSAGAMWATLPLGIVLVVVQLSLRAFRRKKFVRGDFWCLAASLFMLGRLVAHYYLLRYGSTRILSANARSRLMDPAHKGEFDEVVLGSKLILITRTCLILALWCLKMAVADMTERLAESLPWERKVMRAIYVSLFLTFPPALITLHAECHPYNKHWQIFPTPGHCVVGNVWLITYESCNIITDMFLLVTPLRIILSIRVKLWQRLKLLLLFSIGLFLIAISIVRIEQGYGSRQQCNQTLWASLELFLAVVVAVMPTIYGLIRNSNDQNMWSWSQDSKTTNDTDNTEVTQGAVEPIDYDSYNPRGWRDLKSITATATTSMAMAEQNRIEGLCIERQSTMSDPERGSRAAVKFDVLMVPASE